MNVRSAEERLGSLVEVEANGDSSFSSRVSCTHEGALARRMKAAVAVFRRLPTELEE